MKPKTIAIIYAGGTLGMRRSQSGFSPAADLQSLIRSRIPELDSEELPAYRVLETDDPVDSANTAPADWYRLADRVREAGKTFDGIVVVHGTDTLAYTASALSFLLASEHLPVILTGAQVPLAEVRSDAPTNLLGAVTAAAADRIDEVCIFFGQHLYRGNRATKVRTSRFDAFDSPNRAPLGEFGAELLFPGYNGLGERTELFAGEPIRPPAEAGAVSLLQIFPGFDPRIFACTGASGVRGLVLQCYGAGTAPTADPAFRAALRDLADRGVVTVAVTQALQGQVSLARYTTGRALLDAGVCDGRDMTTEAALTKLHALFGLGLPADEIRQLVSQNLCGELTPA